MTSSVRRSATSSVTSSKASSRSTLFPSPADRKRWDHLLTNALASAHEQVAGGSVTPSIDRAGFDRALAAYDFERPQPFEDLARWTIAQMQHGVVHMTHPRYFGLFNPCPTFPAQAADRIAAAFNPQLASAVTSPAAVAIETHVISAIARRAGLPAETTGHFTSGGSEANCTALICALTQATRQYYDSSPMKSMCSAIQPASRAMALAIRNATHFLPNSALPP